MLDPRNERLSDKFRDHMRSDDMDRAMRYMRDSMSRGDHFSESEAEYLVSKMYHTENGRKYSGEKFDMHKAKEVCERYRGILPTSVTATDVYVAINSQYHDYAELFRSWFTDGIEQKVILSFCLLYKYYTCIFKVIYLLYCRQIKFYLSLHLFKITLRREVYGRRT